MKKIIFIILLLSLLISCKGEDGNIGNVYVKMNWTNDIDMFDLYDLIAPENYPDYFYQDQKYELIPGKSGFVYWRSNGTWYWVYVINPDSDDGESGESDYIILPKSGDDGEDVIVNAFFSGNTYYFE